MKHAKQKLYRWVGIDCLGYRHHGYEYTQQRERVAALLQQQGLKPVIISRRLAFTRNKITKKTIISFTRQLATLLHANIPLNHALTLLITSGDVNFKPVLLMIQKKITGGMRFASALRQFPRYFDDIYCQLIDSAENTATLPTTMRQLAQYLEQMDLLHQRLKRALVYPLTVLIVAVTVSYCLMLFVVPQFQQVFANFSAKLPWFTAAMIKFADYLQRHSLLLLICTSLSILLSVQLIKHWHWLQTKLDYSLITLPLTKNFVILAELARWSRVLATLQGAHMQLPEALAAANSIIQNKILKTDCERLQTRIQMGLTLQQALSLCEFIPKSLTQLIIAGANSTQLPKMLDKIAKQLQTDLNERLIHLSKLIEPAIMVLLAGITGSLVIAMYLPVFNMGSLM